MGLVQKAGSFHDTSPKRKRGKDFPRLRFGLVFLHRYPRLNHAPFQGNPGCWCNCGRTANAGRKGTRAVDWLIEDLLRVW